MSKMQKSLLHVFLCAIVAVCAVSLAAPAASAATGSLEEKSFDIGLGGGIWFPGTIKIEDVDVDKTAGFLVRVFGDAYLMPKFAVGAYLNYSSFDLESGPYKVDASMYEFGIALKPRFILSPTMALKPGLNIGYRHSSVDEEGFDDAQGLALNLSVELQIATGAGIDFFIEGGFLTQPAGGNDDADVTWAPIVYLAGGIVF